MPRKRRSTGNKVDTKSNLKQVQSTAPKRTIKGRGSTWAPSKSQQTITQMNPSIYLPAPEYEGLTTDDDQEQESYIASPRRRKKRKITPAKTSSRKASTGSAQRQTITQMVPFRALYHPELEEENLDDLEEEHKENNVPSPMKKTKRKVSPESAPSGKIRKRRQVQETARSEQPGQGTEYDDLQQKKQIIPSKQKCSGEFLHPPVTPRSQRKEIPSSQSPADTPLSTRSKRSFRAYSRSPLKERSTNIAPATTSRRNGTRGERKVEIADSMESREEESPVLMRASTCMAVPDLANSSGLGGKYSELPTDSTVTWTAGLDYISNDWQWEETQQKDFNQATLGREIIDSDEDNDDDDPGASLIRAGTLHSKDTTRTQQPMHHNQRDPFSTARSSNSPQSYQQSNPRNSHSILRSSLTRHTSPNSPPSPPSIPPLPLTDSAQASAQLLNDLHRITEPTLETESQFEAGWHSYHPPSLPSSPPQPTIESPSSSAPMTVPTQPLLRRSTADSTHNLPPYAPAHSTKPHLPVIPPSQATTTDTTQPSPSRKMPSSQQPFHSPHKIPTTSSKTAALAFPSSPPPMLPPSSPPPMPPPPSSSLGVGESTAAGLFQWDGVRLTDSQLLPESLLRDDSLIGGWGISQEGFEEEEEE